MARLVLSVLGLSASQSQSGAYALILQEETSGSRIPIIIGSAEAQAIAIALEGLKPPRPLTHDLFVNLSQIHDISLLEVEINKVEEGVFYAQLILKSNKGTIKMDARTSDAIALAIRFQSPIYVSASVLKKAGIILDEKPKKTQDFNKKQGIPPKEEITKLKVSLAKAINDEDYEQASIIKTKINKIEDSIKG